MALTDDTPDVAEAVLEVLSETVLTVGALLDEVFDTYPDFDEWVLLNLPLRPHTAERIRAMHHLYRDKPDCPTKPEAWKALWAMD